ncbi:Fc.00g083340.m01.CDS01 [Cosmosporella sp. VM-42]
MAAMVSSVSKTPPKVSTSPSRNQAAWLCQDGPYQDYISAMSNLNPGFKQADPGNTEEPLSQRQVAISLLEVTNGRILPTYESASRQDFPDLGRRLQQRPEGSRNIWLLEGLNPEIVALFGDHFGIDPHFFLEFERTSRWRRKRDEANLLRPLPSTRSSQQHFCIPYYEVRELAPEHIRSYSISCAETGRYLALNKWNGSWLGTSIVDRKCGFWSRKTAGGGWDAVVLSDPPLKALHVWMEREPGVWKPDMAVLDCDAPFQGGYLDFIPRLDTVPNLPRGPPRKALQADLRYYLETHVDVVANMLDDPLVVSVFLKKIVASHYMQVINYNGGLLFSMERPLLRRDDLSSIEMAWAEGRWSDLQTASRRCGDYIDSLEELMLCLKIPASELENLPTPIQTWTDSNIDFQHLLRQAITLKDRASAMNEAFTGLTGIVGNAQSNREAQRSIREAKSVKVLTLIAMIFIPLSFTCGLFSMGENYLPGKSRFWVFFVVSIPLVLVLFIVAEFVDHGYDREGVWSRGTFLGSLKSGRFVSPHARRR